MGCGLLIRSDEGPGLVWPTARLWLGAGLLVLEVLLHKIERRRWRSNKLNSNLQVVLNLGLPWLGAHLRLYEPKLVIPVSYSDRSRASGALAQGRLVGVQSSGGGGIRGLHSSGACDLCIQQPGRAGVGFRFASDSCASVCRVCVSGRYLGPDMDRPQQRASAAAHRVGIPLRRFLHRRGPDFWAHKGYGRGSSIGQGSLRHLPLE
jgi:hypothetical protein